MTRHPRTTELLFDHRAQTVGVKDGRGRGIIVADDVDELLTRGDVETDVSLVTGMTFVTHADPLDVEVTAEDEGGSGLVQVTVRPKADVKAETDDDKTDEASASA